MRVLGIDTSCDETGVAVYDGEAGLLAHALYSQAHIHAEYGGVVPEIASRDHVRKLLPLLDECLILLKERLHAKDVHLDWRPPEQDIRVQESQLNLYRLDNFRYPSTDEGLEALVPRYLDRMPEDPWGQAYLYLSPGEHGARKGPENKVR